MAISRTGAVAVPGRSFMRSKPGARSLTPAPRKLGGCCEVAAIAGAVCSAARIDQCLEAQRKRRAARDSPARMSHNRRRDRTRTDDRVSPVVELDELGDQIGAHTVTIALDAVDGERDAIAHDAAAAMRATLQRRSSAWSMNSPAKTRSAEASSPAAPSGCRHAPRPA